jgi:hypothetical protein
MASRAYLFTVSLAVLLAFAAYTPPAQAQVLYGSIVGTITDPSGAAVPEASVTIVNIATGHRRETTSTNQGTYTISDLPAGTYDITISKPGFKQYSAKGLPVSVGRVQRSDVRLAVGATTETVEVTAEAPVLQTDSAQVQTEIANTNIENLPVPVNRNYESLLVTVPGFTPPENQHSVAVNPSRGMSMSVNGATRNSNNLRIDGASSTNVWLPHVPGYVPSLEAIQEVSVVTNSADAAEGLAGGAVVNVHIKSGTNDFHGSAYEYHSDSGLKARPYNFFSATPLPKPRYVYNDFGGTIGGPIVRNKLFFFLSYEGNPVHQTAQPASDLTVPTSAMRLGDFSASSSKIFDPLTGDQTNGKGRTQFVASSDPASPNYNPACASASCPNMIPVSRLDPIAMKVVGLIPAATNPGLISNNFHVTGPYNFTRHTTDGKVDWKPTDKLSLSERIGFLHYDVFNAPVFGDLVGQGVSSSAGRVGNGHGNVISNTVSGTYVFTPKFLVDGYVALTKFGLNQEPPRLDENLGLDFLGIPGTNGQNRQYGGWPQFNISDFDLLGSSGSAGGPIFYDDRQWQYAGNATWLHGNHTIRFGGELMRQAFNHFETGAAAGRFSFNGNATTLNGSKGDPDVKSANLFNSFAQFLLGLPSSVGKDLIPFDNGRTIAYSHNYGFYMQDTWQALRSLTVTYGLRWDHFPVGTRNGRGMERYDFDSNLITLCGLGGTPEDCGYEVSYKEFSPRVGLAWRATSDFVVRAGYSINFDPYPLAFVRDMLGDYPQSLSLSLGASSSFLPSAMPDGSYTTLAKGIPAIAVPDISSGVIPLPKNFSMQTLPQNIRRDYVQSWNLTLQKDLFWGFNGQAGYVGSRQVAVPQFFNLNAGQILGAGSKGQAYFARNGNVGLNLIIPTNHTAYDSLQTKLSRRFTNGFMLNVAYTFSKAIGICCDQLADKNPAIQIPQYFAYNRALAPYDRTHVFSVATVAELPFGEGKPWLNQSGIASKLLGGWQVNSLLSAYSGTPFNVTASGGSLNAPGNTQIADRVKPEVKILGGVGPNPYFDPLAFAPVTEARFGNSGFMSMRGPSSVYLDMSLFRNFQITERFKLQFRAEAFNLPNTPHFANPSANVSNLQLNTDGTVKSLGGYDQITKTTATGRDGIDERQLRFGVRLSF